MTPEVRARLRKLVARHPISPPSISGAAYVRHRSRQRDVSAGATMTGVALASPRRGERLGHVGAPSTPLEDEATTQHHFAADGLTTPDARHWPVHPRCPATHDRGDRKRCTHLPVRGRLHLGCCEFKAASRVRSPDGHAPRADPTGQSVDTSLVARVIRSIGMLGRPAGRAATAANLAAADGSAGVDSRGSGLRDRVRPRSGAGVAAVSRLFVAATWSTVGCEPLRAPSQRGFQADPSRLTEMGSARPIPGARRSRLSSPSRYFLSAGGQSGRTVMKANPSALARRLA